MKVNDKSFEIFEGDTENTIKIRIAAILKTLPEYIEKIHGLPDKITSENLKDINKQKIKLLILENEDDSNFNDFRKNFPDVNLLDAAKLWLSLRKKIIPQGGFDLEGFERDSIDELFKKLHINLSSHNFYKNELFQFNKSLTERKKDLILIDKKNTEHLKKLAQLEEVKHLDFKEESFEYFLKTDIKSDDISLENIFSMIVCNEKVPFISLAIEDFLESYSEIQDNEMKMGKNYKIYKDFADNKTIPIFWKDMLSNQIIIQINNSKFLNNLNQSEINKEEQTYTQCFGLLKDGFFCLSLEIKHINNITKEELEERLLSVFPNVKITEKIVKNLTGFIFYANSNFNTYIMSDLMMNNTFFSKYLAVNESEKSTKKKSGLYVYFFLNNRFEGTCNIMVKKGFNQDFSFVDPINRKDLVKNFYIRLRLKKIKDLQTVKEFAKIFSKLLSLYDQEKNQIIKYYQKFIPNFKEEIFEKEVYKKTIKDLAPDLFTSNYSRICSVLPEIIDDSQVKKKENEGYQVMKFPKTEKEGIINNYICTDKKKKYPGLRKNTLESKDKYAYLPCCYKDNQNLPNKNYHNYLNDIQIKETQQQQVYKSEKFVDFSKNGVLPVDIEKILFAININNNYIRRGVHETINDKNISFLECVLEGVNHGDDFRSLSEKKKIKFLAKELKDLTKANLSIACQENPGKSNTEMQDLIKNSYYFDPRQWIRLCENRYNCKIFVFTKSQDDKISFLVPNFKEQQISWKDKESEKTILIYEHWGLLSEQAKFPRCEIIVYTVKDKQFYSFDKNTCIKINNIYTNYFNQYSVSGFDIKKIKFFSHIKIVFDKQYIDSYGKTRILIKDNVSIITDPLQPLDIERVDFPQKYTSIENARYFIKLFNITIIHETEKEIKIKLTEKITGIIKIDNNIRNLQMQQNIGLNYYSAYKRTAMALIEYFIYFYSIYLNKIKEFNVKNFEMNIKNFITTHVKIDSKVDYGIPETPTTDINYLGNNNVIKDKKIIVDTKQTLKKLVFNLILRIKNNQEEVLNYKDKKEIQNFYFNPISLIQPNKNNIIIQNLDNIQKINTKIDSDKSKVSEIIPSEEDIKNQEFIKIKDSFILINNGTKINLKNKQE